MNEANNTSGRKWTLTTLLTVRLYFEKDPIAHTMIHMAGKEAPNLVRHALREYALNHNLPATNPEIQKQVALQGTQHILDRAHQASPINQAEHTPTKTINQATPQEATPKVNKINDLQRESATQKATPQIAASTDVPTPKPRQVLDFGAAPETMATNETTLKPDPQTNHMEKQHHQWFKDDDKY